MPARASDRASLARLALKGAAVKVRAMSAFRILALAGLAVLGGCGSSAPALLNGSEQGVVVRYNQSDGTSADAVAAAEKFCGQYGRKAVQGNGNTMTGDTYVAFTCQMP